MKRVFRNAFAGLLTLALAVFLQPEQSQAENKKLKRFLGGVAVGTVLGAIIQNAQKNRQNRVSSQGNAYLGRDQLMAVQYGLATMGYYRLALDGMDGPGTRTAVQRFQMDYGYIPTGIITADQIEALNVAATQRMRNAIVQDIASGIASSGQGAESSAPSGANGYTGSGSIYDTGAAQQTYSNAPTSNYGNTASSGNASLLGNSDSGMGQANNSGSPVQPSIQEDARTSMIRQYRDTVANYDGPNARSRRCQLAEQLLNTYGMTLPDQLNESIMLQMNRDNCYG